MTVLSFPIDYFRDCLPVARLHQGSHTLKQPVLYYCARCILQTVSPAGLPRLLRAFGPDCSDAAECSGIRANVEQVDGSTNAGPLPVAAC